ncbi:uncharacterized protein C3orf22 homolog [Pan paniscus]|uniref:Chromosome 3 open reading frame 22 n=1 Tax=Pan paniscus TaxID=9597 RepID=A0A2R9C675_PANPA|nr:uncharacterized protein C3orf22 homolog [Pan paniscus]XP_054966361.1 uncharacterized protein C3orf22 homolog [Pan paniscus]
MDSSACKKFHQSKKWRIQAQENFAKKFPYRLSWLTEPDPEPLQPWEVTNDSNTVQLPLQKRLVPTRSIPVRGLGAPDFTSPSGSCPAPLPAPSPPPLCNLWELKLLSRRLPRQLAFLLSTQHTEAACPQTSEAAGLSRGLS